MTREDVVKRANQRLQQIASENQNKDLAVMFLTKMAEANSGFIIDDELGLIISKNSHRNIVH